MTPAVVESTGSLIEAVATQECFVYTALDGRRAAASRYGVAFEVGGVANLSPRLFLTEADARAALADYQDGVQAKVVTVFVEVSDA